MKKLHYLVIALFISAIFLCGCEKTPTTLFTTFSTTTTTEQALQQAQESQEIYSIYLLALEAGGYSGTYEEWLDSVQGPEGDPGKQVLLRVSENSLEWQYEGDVDWNFLFDLDLLAGSDGIGIQSVAIDTTGNLVITYSDNSTNNLGPVITVYSVEFKDASGFLYSSQVVGVGGDATAPTGIVKAGYEFSGWDGVYENVTRNTVVTALFNPLGYTVSFDSAGGSVCESMTEVPYGSSVVLPEPTKDGYDFLGWFQGSSINSAPFHDSDRITGELALVARWELSIHAVCFEDDDGTLLLSLNVPHGSSAYLPANPTKEGYSFSGWNNDTTMITFDVIMKPVFTPNNYTINFNCNGGIAVSSITLPYLTDLPELQESTRIGHDFLGWFSDASLMNPVSLTTMPLGGATLYAKWQILSYTITYDSQGGTEIASQTLNYNQTLSAPEEPFREFFEFVGWSSSSDTYVAFTFATMPADDFTIYAIWKEASIQYMLLEDGTYAVSGVDPDAVEIIVPSIYKDAAVSKIMTGVFANSSLITSLTIPDSVLTMEAGCLSGLSMLENLSLPFVGITRDAIDYDGTLGMLFGVDTFPGSVVITHYFPSIVRKSYAVPSSLRKLTITDGLALRVGSLSGLSMLTEVVVSDSVTTIEAGTFALTLSLKSMTLPFIGITMDSTGDEGLFGVIFGTRNYGIVATIYPQGTYGCYLPTYLETLKITGGTFINDHSLMNLRNLREISLPSTITSIGSYAFYNDIALTNIILPSQITIIGDYAFSYQHDILPSLKPALNAIVLPSSLSETGMHPFGYTDMNITLVIYSTISSTNVHDVWADLDAEYTMFFDVESVGVHDGLNYVIVDRAGATILGPDFGNQATSIVIPNYIDPDDSQSRVITIASGAFAHDPFLEQLWIGGNIYYVRTNAVAGENLTVYLESQFIPEWWTTANWNPSGVPVVLNATMPQ